MDAMGKLAGGIAHDFNNVLGGSLSATELLQMAVRENEKASEYVRLLRASMQQATDLSSQLLNFSGRSPENFVPMDINKTVLNAITALQEAVDSKVKIDFKLEAEAVQIKGDPVKLQSALMSMGFKRGPMP